MSAFGAEVSATAQKGEAAKKTELIKEIQLSKLKISALQREKASLLYNKHNKFYADYAELETTESKQESGFALEKSTLLQQLARMREMVDKFRSELRDVKPTPEFVEKLKVTMEEIESLISTFKEQQRQQYEQLLKDEHMLGQEVLAFEKRVDTWLQQQQQPELTSRAGTVTQAPVNTARDLPREVIDLEKFLASCGGLTGGWDEYDHGTFLRYRQQYKGKGTFIADLASALATRTEDEIRQHEDWYNEYLTLNERKKEAIRKWRIKKEEEKEQAEDLGSDEDEVETARKREDMDKMLMEERRERRAKLNKWKVDKELEKAEADARKQRAAAEKERKELEERQRQMELRERVTEFKRQRQCEEDEKRAAADALERLEMEEKRRMAEQMIPRFVQRDFHELQRKQSKQKMKAIEEKEKEERLERLRRQVEVRVDRDPERLLQPTKGWREKQREGPSAPNTARAASLNQVQHRAVPTWRQGLS